jgi:hypothetical protein
MIGPENSFVEAEICQKQFLNFSKHFSVLVNASQETLNCKGIITEIKFFSIHMYFPGVRMCDCVLYIY